MSGQGNYLVLSGQSGSLLCDLRVFESGNGSHIPHDFAFLLIIDFMPGKQHNRRFPDESISQAFSILRRRVSCCFAVVTEKIQSLRASAVMSIQDAFAPGAVARAFLRSVGTLVAALLLPE